MKDLDKQQSSALYEEDFARWCEETAAALREGRFGDIDAESLAEEILAMANRDRRELDSRMIVLIKHLLKLKCQQWMWFKKASWEITVAEQRRQISMMLKQSPSLKCYLEDEFHSIYHQAWMGASKEMKLRSFTSLPPSKCPFTIEQILDPSFLPN